MKTAKKALLLTVCALVLVAATVMGTLAYLTDTDKVVNTLTVGHVKITLEESVTDEYGVPTTGKTSDGNEYKLIPSYTYTKDPVITLDAESQPSYLFVRINNGLAAIEAVGDTTIAKQMENLGWAPVGAIFGQDNSNVYFYKDVVNAGQQVKVFETLTLAGDAKVADYNTATNPDAKISVIAYAVQRDGFKDATIAWANTFGDPSFKG